MQPAGGVTGGEVAVAAVCRHGQAAGGASSRGLLHSTLAYVPHLRSYGGAHGVQSQRMQRLCVWYVCACVSACRVREILRARV